MINLLRSGLTKLGVLSAHPAAFAILAIYAVSWAVLDPAGLDWHGVATLATWCMTLLIQRAEHRDTQAIHAKLDELLHASSGGSNALTKLDEREPETIERYRDAARAGD